MDNKKFMIAMVALLVMMVSGTVIAVKVIRSYDGDPVSIIKKTDDEIKNEEDSKKKHEEEIKKYNDTLGGDAKKMVNALKEFQRKNGGAIPKDWNIYYDVYLDPDVVDRYEFAVCDMNSGNCPNSKELNWYQHKKIVYVTKHAYCFNGNAVYTSNAKSVAFVSTKMSDSTLPTGNVCTSNN